MPAVSHLHRIAEQFRAARRDPGLAVLEGFHAVMHAIRFGAELVALVGTDADGAERLARTLAPDLRGTFSERLHPVSPDTFSQLAPQAPRTGVMAIARRPRVDVAAALSDPRPRPVILLEDPRNLGNMGACVRVAAAADAGAVLTTGSQDPWQPDVLRGAAGLHFAIPVARITQLGLRGRPLIAVDPRAPALDAAQLPSRSVLAFGTERYGISEDLSARADQSISIPMRAGVSSLNLATAVAAVLFTWRLTATSDTNASAR
jgi:RNA methyltransferase, TrmH family